MPAYTISIYKSWGARNLEEAWVNRYLVNSAAPDVTGADVQTTVDAFVAMEAELHLDQVQFLHATYSSTVKEAVYDPRQLRVFETQGTGHRGIPDGDTALDLNIALKAKKVVAFGRSGTMFYRGALTAADVNINSRGESELRADSPMMVPGTWSNAWGHVHNLTATPWIMDAPVLHDPNNQTPFVDREVQNLLPAGVSINKRNHKYFDSLTAEQRSAIRAAIATNGSVTFTTVDGNTGQVVLPAPINGA